MEHIAGFDNARVALKSGTVIEYREEGAGPPVVLLHGLNAHSGTWRRNTSLLAQTRRVIAPSLPPAASLSSDTIEQYASQIHSFLAVLKLERTAMVGNSMGGWLAMKLASSQTSTVRCLVLEDTAGFEGADSARMISSLNLSGTPILIVWGAVDSVIPVSTADRLHSALKTSRLVVIERAGHVPHWERPELFNRMVSSFLDGEIQ